MDSWTFGRKIALGFGLSFAMLVLVGTVAYRSADALIENDHRVTHSHAVIEALAHVISVMKDAETGQRGFLLTGQDGYLEPYNAAIAEAPHATEDLRRLLEGQLRNPERLDDLDRLVNLKLSELRQTIDLRRTAGFDAAQKVVLSDVGKNTMDELRRVVASIDADQRQILRDRSDSAEASAASAKSTIVGGALLALVLVAFAGFTITRSLGTQLAAAIARMKSSSSELQAAAAQQAAGSREQSSATNEVSTTIRELLATSRQIAESAQRVARIAEDTARGAKDGDVTVQRAQDAIVSIKRQVDLIVGQMLDLGKKSQQAGAILELVNELSEQTNILAINATIEAAGAGEGGKRFAVVADEIRKLADRVGGSTKEIRALIEDIRGAVNATVMVTETGTKAVDAGARQFADVTSSFQQIASLVSTTTDAAREIELSTKQQSTAVEQVNLAISNVAQSTKESEASATQTLQTATELASLSSELSRIVTATANAAH